MRDLLQRSFWVIGLSLQFLVLSSLINGPIREFPFIFGYIVTLLFTTVVEIAVSGDVAGLHTYYKQLYWFCELLRQSALFAVTLSLLAPIMPSGRRRASFVRGLVAVAVLFWVGSLVVHYHSDLTPWMTKVVRNLSFCSAMVALVVWFKLLSAENRDYRLLMLAGGIGLQMTGDAIGQSVRQLARELTSMPNTTASLVGGIVTVLTHFLCLFIFWHALRQREQELSHAARGVAH